LRRRVPVGDAVPLQLVRRGERGTEDRPSFGRDFGKRTESHWAGSRVRLLLCAGGHGEDPEGVIVQLGGQTPLKLTRPLEALGVRILGTSPDAIDIAEDRKRFEQIARELGIRQPDNGTATSVDEAVAVATEIGYPVLVRPSYVLGGRAMQIVYDEETLREYFVTAARVSEDRPVLIDSFLEDAFEADVDAVSDGQRVVIGGVMQHIED